MTPQAKLIALLALALAVVLGGLGCYAWGHSDGDDAGALRVQQEWDKAKDKAEQENQRIRGEGFDRANEFEAQLRELEKRYANVTAKRRAAQQLPVTCPATGVIGDVVVPAALVRSMFNRDDAGSADSPGPAASEPAR